jgi:hypothetical protein
VLWLWSVPAVVRKRIADKIDRFGARNCSAASHSSVSSFSSGGKASSSSAIPTSPESTFESKRSGTSPSADEEMVEVTILESGACSSVDDSVSLALCLLLSSHLVYNGMNMLDAAQIQQLTALRDLPKNINTRADAGMEDGVAFREHFPRLSWVLRDSDAQLLDERRHPISPAAYLERALKVRGFSDEAEQKNMIRKMIASFFPDQDCHVLPTPAPIPGLPLGDRFLRKVVSIRSVLADVPVKNVRGLEVDGAMLQDLAQSYADDLNAAQPLCIPKACDYMSVSRCKLAMKRALEHFDGELAALRAQLPMSDIAVQQWYDKTRKRTKQVLANMAVTDVEELRAQLDVELLELQKEVMKANEDASRTKAVELLETLYSDCERRVRSGEISSLDVYETERNAVRTEFEFRTAQLAQYTCRMTMLEFMENRLMRFSQTLLRSAAQLQPRTPGRTGSASPGRVKSISPANSSKSRTPPLPPSQRRLSPGFPPGAEEGQWVKREVLDHVKRKAKADLAVGSCVCDCVYVYVCVWCVSAARVCCMP